MSVRDDIDRRLLAIPGVRRRRSRWGVEPAYYLGEREVAHFHRDGRLDVRLTKELLREMRSSGGPDPRVRVRGPSADWAAVTASDPSDIALIVELVEDAVRANE